MLLIKSKETGNNYNRKSKKEEKIVQKDIKPWKYFLIYPYLF